MKRCHTDQTIVGDNRNSSQINFGFSKVAATLQHLNLSLEILSSSDKNMARLARKHWKCKDNYESTFFPRTNHRAAPVKNKEGW